MAAKCASSTDLFRQFFLCPIMDLYDIIYTSNIQGTATRTQGTATRKKKEKHNPKATFRDNRPCYFGCHFTPLFSLAIAPGLRMC